MKISASRARALLRYDPETGDFFWRVTRNNFVQAGSKAGCLQISGPNKGYIGIKILGKSYGAHRLAWLWVTGRWATKEIDHIDHCRSNNRLSNLRAVTPLENQHNKRRRSDNASGVTGVHFTRKGKWVARINKDRKRIVLGTFNSFEQAVAVREAAKKMTGYHQNHGI